MSSESRVVIMLHGLGGDQRSMLPIGEYCSNILRDTRFLTVEGPITFGNVKTPCLGWFEAPEDNSRALEGPKAPGLKGIDRSIAAVHGQIDNVIAEGVDPLRIHLLGHSQGGAIAITAGLTYRTRLGSVCTIAGYLALTPQMKPAPVGTHYFLHHSIHDDNVGYRWAKYARSFVETTGNYCAVRSWDLREAPHSIHAAQLGEICETIARA